MSTVVPKLVMADKFLFDSLMDKGESIRRSYIKSCWREAL